MVQRLLRAWDKIRPGTKRPPLTRSLAFALAREVRRFGQPAWAVPMGGPRRSLAAAAAAAVAATARTEPFRVCCLLVLMFAGFLRISEMFALRREDMALPGDPRLFAGARGQAAGLRVRWAKTGAEQFVSVEDETALAALRWLAAHTAPGGLLVAGMQQSDLRAVLAEALRRLGLAGQGYVPHSLRHGAATDAFACGVDIRTIAARGRWESEASLRRYVQAGRAMALAAELPQAARDEVAAVDALGTLAVLGPGC
jgi:integrase